jgi:hypothetical protein
MLNYQRVVPVGEYAKIFVIVIIVKTTVLHFLLELISRMFLPTFKKKRAYTATRIMLLIGESCL